MKCACKHNDARQCFLLRHPECKRRSDDTGTMYDEAIDCECECSCHHWDEDEYYASMEEPWGAE